MKLPSPPKTYDQNEQVRTRDQLELADKQNLKRGQDIEMGAARIIIRSPDGTRYVLTASNPGALTLVAL